MPHSFAETEAQPQKQLKARRKGTAFPHIGRHSRKILKFSKDEFNKKLVNWLAKQKIPISTSPTHL